MQNIIIIVREKIARAFDDTHIVCGNSDYIAVFDFDAEWDAYETKTARFIWNGKYTDVVFTGTRCPVPVITGAFGVLVGVYAGDLHTTTAATVDTEKSILCRNGLPADPPPDVYAQIIAMLNGMASPEWRDIQDKPFSALGDGLSVDEDGNLHTEPLTDAEKDEIAEKVANDVPLPLSGSAAPTEETAGVVGQEYYVIVDNAVTEMYVCTSALIGSYTWDKVEFGGGYTLPEASATALGGIKADEAQAADTQAVRKGADGKLYTAPGTVTDAQVNTAVSSWLTEHPEATTTVADGSVTPQKTSFLEVKYHNILNWNDTDAQDGYFFYTGDSAAITGGGGADYCVSGYIPVEAGKTYCFVKVRKVKWLDSAKTYISTSSPSDADIKFTAPENAAFARIDTESARKEIAYIYEYNGEEYDYSAYATEYEIFSGDQKYSDMITRSIVSSMNDGSVNVPNLIPENTLDYKQIKGTNEFHWNIINPEKCRFGIEISETTGAEVNKGTTNLYYYTSDYTAVESNEILMGGNYRVIGYDSDKQFVSKITWSGGKYIIPDNVKFIRAHASGYATAQDSAKIVLLRNKYGKSFVYSDNYSYDYMFPMFANEDCLNGYKGYLGVRSRSNDKICVIGDSFTAPSTWVNLMCEKLGAYKIANHAVSGGAFSDYDGVPKTAYEQAQEMVANSETPDVILVTIVQSGIYRIQMI